VFHFVFSYIHECFDTQCHVMVALGLRLTKDLNNRIAQHVELYN